MNAEIEKLAKLILKQEKNLETFNEKKEGSSARQDLVDEIIRLEEKLAQKVLSYYRNSSI